MAIYNNADAVVHDQGSIQLFQPISQTAKTWVADHIPADAMWVGPSVAVEVNYIDNIVDGARDDGLVVAY